jgi:hypothetical protein
MPLINLKVIEGLFTPAQRRRSPSAPPTRRPRLRTGSGLSPY